MAKKNLIEAAQAGTAVLFSESDKGKTIKATPKETTKPGKTTIIPEKSAYGQILAEKAAEQTKFFHVEPKEETVIPEKIFYPTENASQTAQEGRQAVRTGKSSTEREKAEKGVKTAKKAADPVKVFSFRAAVQDVDQWRLYAAIRGEKVDEIGAAAMREYLKRHPLSAEEKALFDKRIESMKS